MTAQLTVTLPEKVYKRMQRLAELAGRNVEETLAETLDSWLPPLSSELDSQPVESLSDDEVLALSESMMDEVLSKRMSALLYKQQAEPMSEAEQAELKMLMDIYGVGQLRKGAALAEAVKRGLRGRLEP